MDLKDQFDVVILGTGLAESILSAACSRIGKSVLHIDKNSFYGESWSSFNFEQLVEWLTYGKVDDLYYCAPNKQNDQVDKQASNSHMIDWTDFYKTITNIEIDSYLVDEKQNESKCQIDGEIQNEKCWTTEEFKKLSRKFNIDLCPKLLFATGSMVKLLVSSNISRYVSFKNVTRMLCNKDESLELIPIPYSRQTIFLSDSISLIEKRILMKFMQFCLEVDKNADLIKDFVDKSFVDLMSYKGLTPFLQKIILQCVLLTGNKNISTSEAMPFIKKFVDSSGRYGNTPFLSSLYGSGEIPQSFCRLSAVFAGTFLLNNTISKIVINNSQTEEKTKVFELVLNQKHINATHLITSIDTTPKRLINSNERLMISRGIFITNRSIKQLDDKSITNKEISLVYLDFGDLYHNVYLLELSSALCVCPDDLYLVYIWVDSVCKTAKQDLLPIVKNLFNLNPQQGESNESNLKPNIIWSCYYNTEYINASKNSNLFKNHYVLSTAYNELDFDKTINEARDVFSSMFPNEEFCERAPDLEELVFEPNTEVDGQKKDSDEDDNEMNID